MVEVDGSGGGGQILRTALGLSMLGGEAVELTGVRENRPDPGLKAQHLTAVETAAAVCGATVEGADMGATELSFDPGEPTGGEYEAAVGTAGSLTLLFDTLVPVAARLDDPLALTATGGTDVKWSPPMAYYRRVKLPLLREAGLAAVVDPDRAGFYPAGGGRATLRLWPSTLTGLEAPDSGDEAVARVYSTATRSLDDADVAQRQATAAERELADAGIDTVARETASVEAHSTGSALVVRLDETATRAGFSAYGERGTPAEDVATAAVDDLRAFRETATTAEATDRDALAVDDHLADQALLALALGGGSVAVSRVTDHLATSLPVFAAFGYDLSVDETGAVPVVTG